MRCASGDRSEGEGFMMRFWRRVGHPVNGKDGPDPDTCEHSWRLRAVSSALPGDYVCEVCDRCGALRVHGPEEITGPATRVEDGAASYLEALAQRRSQDHGHPPQPPH